MTNTRTRTSGRHGATFRKAGWLAAGSMLAVAALAPASVGAATTWATVTGYAEGSSGNNNAAAWGNDCTKVDFTDPKPATYVLGNSYDLVIVKAGSESSAPGHVNTLFADASAGETVWADSNGSGAFDDGDKGISHIIFCGPAETTTETTDTTTDTTDTTTETSDTTTETTDTTTETTDTTTETSDTTTETTDTTTETTDTTTETSDTTTETTDTTTETTDTTTETSDTTTETTDTTTETSDTTTETTDTTTETSDTTTETTDTTTETTDTTTETSDTTTETTDSTTTTTSTGDELGAEGTPGVTPPPTDTVRSVAPTSTTDGFRMLLVGFALLLGVALFLLPKEVATKEVASKR